MTAPIGVLLPVRLETLTEQRADGGWTLWLRVIPDEAHLDRHDPRCTEAELDELDAVWGAGAAGFDAAFAVLVTRVGGARALWLTRRFPAGYDRNTVPRRVPGADPPGYAKVAAFPSRYQVYAVVAGIRSLLADQAVAIDQLALDPLAPVAERWWSDWAKAVNVGLGVEIDLGAIDPTAATFEALMVVGIDPAIDAAPLFIAHANAGRLALLDHGTATNTVAGAPTADIKGTPAQWRALFDGPQPLLAEKLGSALGIPAPGLPPIRVGQNQTGSNPFLRSGPWDGELVGALWSALWGFAGHELWGWGDAVHEAGDWAARWLRPLGPLPPIRIAEQPYGVLPVTSLSRWKAEPGDPAFEAVMAPRLTVLREWAANAAAARGTTTGADAERWLDLMADTPTTPIFGARWMLPLALAEGISNSPADLEKWWQSLARAVVKVAGRPLRPYLAISEILPIAIPFVHPSAWDPDGSRTTLVQKILDYLGEQGEKQQWFMLVLPLDLFNPFKIPSNNERLPVPDSLLVRLAWRSLLVAVGHAITATTGASILDAVVTASDSTGFLPNPVLDAIVPSAGTFTPAGDPAGRVLQRTIASLRALAGSTDAELEIAFRAVLDTASHRVDPWITGIATRRLFEQRAAGAATAAGLYGWVDGPLIGKPGPTQGGVLLATSDSQARTAAVLRDKAINDPEARWEMDLDSVHVGAAVRLAEDIAAGAHPAEALGRRVEHELLTRDRVDAVRSRFPLRTGDQGRRVCDGIAVLAPGADLSFLTPTELAAIGRLRPVLDTYADLLIADGVHQTIEGRPERARKSMEAAAGLGTPPDLDVVRSPRPARTAATTVLLVLPDSGGADPARPATLVDAAVAAYLDDVLPAPSDAAWTWTVTQADGTSAALRLDGLTLTSTDLPLRASDALALGRMVLDQMVKQQTGAAGITGRPAALDDGERLLELLRSRPYVDAEPGAPPADDTARLELVGRYQAAREAMKALVVQASQFGLPPATVQQIISTLRPWGVVPTSASATVGGYDILFLAADAMRARLAATPPQPSAADPAGSPEPATAAGLDAATLASALVQLACPSSAFVVLARRPPSVIAALAAPVGEELGDWLGVVATVRPRLAVQDADQLGPVSLTARLDRPGDVWQQTGIPDSGATRLLVGFGTASAFNPGAATVALGEIDRFTEAVPAVRAATALQSQERVLTAAVGFNAPSARAPQAVLLAVAPDTAGSLDADTLFDIVRETREMSHARMARSTELGALAAGLPATYLPKAWISGVELTVDREV